MRSLATLVLRVLYLFAPLVVASMLAAIVMRFDLMRSLRRPIDAGATFRGRRLFGDHKTWRGAVVTVAGCVLGATLQYALGGRAHALAWVDYGRVNVVEFGAAMGLGVVLGELPNSFVKRQLGIEPGKGGRGFVGVLFYVWDQIDVLSSWLFVCPWVHPTPLVVAVSLVMALVLHPLVALLGYLVGARKSAR